MKKLSTKIALIIFSFAFCATSLLAVTLFVSAEKMLMEQVGESQVSIARGIMRSLEHDIHKKLEYTEKISSLSSIKKAVGKTSDQKDADLRTANLRLITPDSLEVSIIGVNGKIISSSNLSKNGSEESEEIYLALIRKNKTTNSGIVWNKEYGEKTFTTVSPVRGDESHAIEGFVKIIFSSSFIKEEIASTATAGNVYLIDSFGKILEKEALDSPASTKTLIEDPKENIENSDVLNFALIHTSDHTIAKSISSNKKSFYGVSRETIHEGHESHQWIVLVERDYEDIYTPTRNSISLMIFIIIVFVFGSASGAVFFVQMSIADPLNDIIKAIKKIPENGIYKTPEIKTSDEIHQLNIAFSSAFNESSQLKIDLEKDVAEKTKELEKIIKETSLQNENLEKTKRAMINILEDARELEGFILNEKNKAEAIIASMGEGLIMVDRNYKVTTINKVTEEILGLPKEKMIGVDLKDVLQVIKKTTVLSPADRPISQVFKTGQTVIAGVGDDFFGKTETKEFPVAFIVSPVKDSVSGEVVGAVAIFRDVTDDKRLSDAKTNFISVASHQLRTPLTSMRWFSEMLLDGDAGKLKEEQIHFVQRIQDSSERMVNLVNLLLQIARVEAGRLMVEPVPLSLEDVTKEVVDSLDSLLKVKIQTVEIKTDPKKMPKIPLDKDIIWQVIQNLLTNANRYASIKSTINVSMVQKGEEIVYSVHNEGIGVPAKQKNRIFEKFFRADNAIKAVPEGSGLGLALIKSVVSSWGGKVWLESEENKGATFYFTISVEGMKPKKGEVKLSI